MSILHYFTFGGGLRGGLAYRWLSGFIGLRGTTVDGKGVHEGLL